MSTRHRRHTQSCYKSNDRRNFESWFYDYCGRCLDQQVALLSAITAATAVSVYFHQVSTVQQLPAKTLPACGRPNNRNLDENVLDVLLMPVSGGSRWCTAVDRQL